MGQILFAPPNVKGWDGGKSWITTSTLLFRYNFANYLVNGDAMLPGNAPARAPGKAVGFARKLESEPDPNPNLVRAKCAVRKESR